MRLRIAGVEHEVDPAKLTFGEARAIEKATAMTFTQWGESMSNGSMVGLQGLVWLVLRRNNPEIRFDDIEDLRFEEVEMIPDDEPEVKANRAARRSTRRVDPTQTA